MRQFIKSTFLFLIFAFIAYVLLICIWGDYAPALFRKNLNYEIGSYGHMFSRIKEAKQTKNVDILFLGSSHTYRGFDTRMFESKGFSSFNFGSSAQSPLQTEVLLKRYLDNLNPKLIVYEVYPGTFSSDGVESSLDIIANDKNDLESFKMAVKQNNIKVWNAYIYSVYRDVFNKNSNFKEAAIKGEDTYIKGGYVEKELKYFKFKKHEKNKWEFEASQFNSFDRTLKIIKDKKIKIIFVEAPVTSLKYKSYTNNAEFDKKMSVYGDYYNFNELIQLNDSLNFYDEHHLNQTGVEIFNNKLLNIISEKYR